MHPFHYEQPQELGSSVERVSRAQEASFLAGGTGLLDLMKLGVETPALLVDVRKLPLAQIQELPDGGVRLGALARNSDVAHHPLIRERYPVLSEALLAGASGQIRNMATVGGNIMQRTRCSYFRDTSTPCNKRNPGSGCSALEGINRGHAVLGVSESCIATHPSDMCVPLAALGATVRIQGPKGERTVPFTDFHLVPGTTPQRETVLEHGELVLSVDVPALPAAKRSLYIKVRDRASYAFALTSVAAILEVEGGVIRQARLALGGVGTKPWRALAAEQKLMGQAPSPQLYQEAAKAALEGAKAREHNGFKVELAQRTIVRALTTLGGRS
ncbi:xanthine dehydrogenase family protein subunit M [Stigmatella sp. ncwal1]|uniref:Xanthine dehydrogenase family protein subunit M n=1 Tax=Stigmatella ashevillensis TaxID=2995309 RepID=A0ABT5D8H7_9BACT|nr:xanthine dehydrogenase family protein subunit M [Stigmatella ashevillena]MDC0709980.1 xanthine dehydrogenase family protein subunit M [Stigmatella ashevillena]